MPSASLSVTITLEDGHLFLMRAGTTSPCIPLDVSHFACDEGQVAFHQTPNGPQLELWRTMIATRVAS